MIKYPNGKGMLLGYLIMSFACLFLIIIWIGLLYIETEIDDGALYVLIGIFTLILTMGTIFAPYEIHKTRIEQNEYKKFINYNKRRRGK